MEAVYEEIIADVLSGQTEYTDRFQREINEFWEDVYGVSDSGTYSTLKDKGKSMEELKAEWYSGGENVLKNMGEGGRKTSIPQVPSGILHFTETGFLKKGDSFFENGAGQYDKTQIAFRNKGIEYYPIDPYNRSAQRNFRVYEAMKDNGGVKASGMANVLNVIRDFDSTIKAIEFAYAPLKANGKMQITVYEGNKKGVWDGSQHNRPLKWYEQFVPSGCSHSKDNI